MMIVELFVSSTSEIAGSERLVRNSSESDITGKSFCVVAFHGTIAHSIEWTRCRASVQVSNCGRASSPTSLSRRLELSIAN
jgi:hypothetical protein